VAAMTKTYFVRRLFEALNQAEQADTEEERTIHLRMSRYYRDLIEAAHKRNST
jgi:hypothetical protein